MFLVSFSLGTTVSFYGMSMFPEWFEENIQMATLIAPTIEFEHSTEFFLLDGAKMTEIPELLVSFNYLEFNGPKTNGE